MKENRKNFAPQREMRRANRYAILCGIAAGWRTKRQLQHRTGLSWGTVSGAVKSLEECGILAARHTPLPDVPVLMPEVPHGKNSFFYFHAKRCAAMGVEITAEAIHTYCGTVDGRTLARKSTVFHPLPGARNLTDAVRRAIADTWQESGASGERLLAVGIALTGAFDAKRRIWLGSPHVPEIADCDLSDLCQDLPLNGPVVLEHDIIAKARAVTASLPGLPEDYVFLHFGEGIGMAIRSGGKFRQGSRGFAGEIGHVPVTAPPWFPETVCRCGKRECLENHLSLRGLRQFARLPKTRDIPADAATYLRPYLLQALVTAVNLFDPAALFIGGETLEACPGLLRGIAEEVRGKSWRNGPAEVFSYRMEQCDTARGVTLGLIPEILSRLSAGSPKTTTSAPGL